MSRIKNKKKTSIVAMFLVVAIAGAAYAYWTAIGDGEGSAATGSVDEAVVVNQTSTISNLRPGGAAQTLSGDFDNPNDEPVYIASVTAALDSVVDGNGDPVAGCTTADYTLTGATMTVNAEIPTGDSQGAWTGATVEFNNTASNQDACQGANLVITYTAQ